MKNLSLAIDLEKYLGKNVNFSIDSFHSAFCNLAVNVRLEESLTGGCFDQNRRNLRRFAVVQDCEDAVAPLRPFDVQLLFQIVKLPVPSWVVVEPEGVGG